MTGCTVVAGSLAATALIASLVLLVFVFQQTLVGTADPALAQPVAIDAAASIEPPAVAALSDEDLAYRRLANALPVFALSLLLLGLTRRPLLSVWLCALAVVSLYTIDALKLASLRTHLLPADVLLLPQVIDSGGLYLNYLSKAGFGVIAAVLLMLITAAFCLEPPWRLLRPAWRGLLIAVGMLLGYAIVTAHPLTGRWYESERLAYQSWNPDASIKQSGLIAALVKLSGDTAWVQPEADEVYVEHILKLHPADLPDGAASDTPDIIIWQSESLFDPARLTSVVGTAAHLPHIAALRARSLHGQMRVPTYGGGTVRTEFEAMTGYPLHAFQGVSYPYSGLAQRPLMSLPRQLRDQGYQTVAIHPYDGNFWNRNRAFVHLGFDRFEDDAHFDHADAHGWYIGDDALLRHVAATLQEPRDRPLFLFAISMENHGPWHERPGIDAAALARIQVPPALSPDAVTELRHYLYHAQRSDRLLAELIALVDARERPTVVLFYGDHLPGLDSAFGQIGFRDGNPAWEQPVPFMLFDNRGGISGEAGGTLRSYHLASMVLDAAGLRESPHFRVLSADRERHGRTGLVDLVPDPLLDYDHALAHLSWHSYQQRPPATPATTPIDLTRASVP